MHQLIDLCQEVASSATGSRFAVNAMMDFREEREREEMTKKTTSASQSASATDELDISPSNDVSLAAMLFIVPSPVLPPSFSSPLPPLPYLCDRLPVCPVHCKRIDREVALFSTTCCAFSNFKKLSDEGFAPRILTFELTSCSGWRPLSTETETSIIRENCIGSNAQTAL